MVICCEQGNPERLVERGLDEFCLLSAWEPVSQSTGAPNCRGATKLQSHALTLRVAGFRNITNGNILNIGFGWVFIGKKTNGLLEQIKQYPQYHISQWWISMDFTANPGLHLTRTRHETKVGGFATQELTCSSMFIWKFQEMVVPPNHPF